MKLFKIIDIIPNPQIARDFSFYEKEFSEMKSMSQITALPPTATEVFFYKVGTDIYVVYKNALGTEVLDETDFATHAKWDVTNDFDDSGGNAAFVWSANQTSTLTQTSGNLAAAGVGSVWYRFTYTVGVTTAFDGDAAATITTAFALAATSLDLSLGTHTIYFFSAVAPTDFVISLVSGSDTEGTISLDDFVLKQVADSSNFNPATDTLYMKYVEDIDGTGWGDSDDLTATPIFLSDSFIRKGIDLASKTLLDEVNL